MAKNPKKSKENAAPESKSAAPTSEVRNGNGAAHPEKPVVAPSAPAKPVKPAGRAKSAPKSRGASPKKATPARKPRATGAKKKAGAGGVAISDEEIRIRAYFISEQRMQNGVPGDSAHDWLEAVRQLQEEAK